MRMVLFCHSLISDWNHGNAHFLRGIVSELLARGHQVDVYEPEDGWSLQNLIAEHGRRPVDECHRRFPQLKSIAYRLESLDLDRALADTDAVLVHEWNEPELVSRIGQHRAKRGRYRLLFHDTHHRSITAPHQMERYELRHYDGVLAFGESIREIYLQRGWAKAAWTWHEAADTRLFRPHFGGHKTGELVWIGNWGDEERTEELREFLLKPVEQLQLNAHVYGVRYPDSAKAQLAQAGAAYHGWLPNYRVPEVFGQFRVTVHVARRPYREQLSGIPTIRVFEALACGIPLITAPWNDSEQLFHPGTDYLVARNCDEMRELLSAVLSTPELATELAHQGRQTILARHTCRHRVDELLGILSELGVSCGSRVSSTNGSHLLAWPPSSTSSTT